MSRVDCKGMRDQLVKMDYNIIVVSLLTVLLTMLLEGT